MSQPPLSMNELIRAMHNADRHRANRLLDQLVVLPPKAQALRLITALLEEVRFEADNNPDVIKEMKRRRLAGQALVQSSEDILRHEG